MVRENQAPQTPPSTPPTDPPSKNIELLALGLWVAVASAFTLVPLFFEYRYAIWVEVYCYVAGVASGLKTWHCLVKKQRTEIAVKAGAFVTFVLYMVIFAAYYRNPISLKPGSKAMPPLHEGVNFWQFPRDSFFFFFGSCIVVCPPPADDKIVLIRGQELDLLTLHLDPSGATVSGKFLSKDGDAELELDHNRIKKESKEHIWTLDRSRHSYIVKESKGFREVLNLEFVNPWTFKLTGVMRSENGSEVFITESNIVANLKHIKGIVVQRALNVGIGLLGFGEDGVGVGLKAHESAEPRSGSK